MKHWKAWNEQTGLLNSLVHIFVYMYLRPFAKNNITDVAQKVMLHMEHILPWESIKAYDNVMIPEVVYLIPVAML